MVDFSQRLKQLRKDKHLTQAQVAQRIGVTSSMVSSYETDIRLPSYEVMVRIADLFGVTVDYLLCRQDKRFLDISDLNDEEAALVCGIAGSFLGILSMLFPPALVRCVPWGYYGLLALVDMDWDAATRITTFSWRWPEGTDLILLFLWAAVFLAVGRTLFVRKEV